MVRPLCVATQSLKPYANLYKSKTKSSAPEPRQKHTGYVSQLSLLEISFVNPLDPRDARLAALVLRPRFNLDMHMSARSGALGGEEGCPSVE